MLITHAVEHEDPVQVIELVLVHARLEIVGLVLDDLAVHIDPTEQDGSWSNQLDIETRDRQAPFVVDPLPSRLDNLGIEDGSTVTIEVPDHDLFLHADLGSSEGDTAVAVIERVEHLLDEADRATIDIGDRRCLRLEHWVAEGSDL